MKNYLKIARIDHWVKNIFIVPGVVIAVLLTDFTFDLAYIWKFVVGFFATCFIASANYVINEWLDADFDKFHPTKKNRPVVSANMKFPLVMLEYAVFALAGMGCSLLISKVFLLMELWLLLMGILYNVKPFRTKDIPYLDVLTESINNMIRLLLGWFIINSELQPPSSILIGYWMGGAFLMAIKRYAEYRMINNPEQAGLYRKSFKYYSEHLLLVSAFFYAMASTFFCGVFMIKYRIEYLVGMPFIFGLFCAYFYISFKEDSAVQKPEKLYKEKKLLAYIAFLVVLFVVLTFVNIPALKYWVDIRLIEVVR